MEKGIKLKIKPIIENDISTIAIEAGHISTAMKPSEEQYSTIRNAVAWSNVFESLGIKVEKWLYLDDYTPRWNNQEETLNVDQYIKTISKMGFAPDHLRTQANMIPKAKENIEFLLEEELAIIHPDTKNILLRKNDILLYEPDLNKYNCPLLDGTLYTEKLDSAGYAMSFLGLMFEDVKLTQQQKRAKLITKALGYDSINKIESVYCNPSSLTKNGNINFKGLCNLINIISENDSYINGNNINTKEIKKVHKF